MSSSPNNYQLTNFRDIPAVPCPCGQAKRAFTDDPAQTCSAHEVTISSESRAHYHKKMTEVYYVLEGSGEIELDGKRLPISVGSAILIKPGCRHRAIPNAKSGELKILNVPVPAFDPHDEWFD